MKMVKIASIDRTRRELYLNKMDKYESSIYALMGHLNLF